MIAEVAQSLPKNPTTPEGVEWASEAERALMATTDDPEAGKGAVSGSNQRRDRYAIRIFCRYLHAMHHSRLQADAVHYSRELYARVVILSRSCMCATSSFFFLRLRRAASRWDSRRFCWKGNGT